MSPVQPVGPGSGAACHSCVRRGWLLSELSGPLDYCARDRTALLELLGFGDDELLKAVAGRRASELRAGYERFDPAQLPCGLFAGTTCRHRNGFPPALSGPASPHMLDVAAGGAAGADRLAKLTAAPVVAIVGSTSASDYGMEMARSLARGLSASGITVTAGLSDGIAVAAHAGALDAGGASVAVLGGGLDVACPARRRSLYERISRRGCAVAELPRDCRGRRWGQLAGERIVAELAALTVLVEAEPTPGALAPARIAQKLGRTLAAIPGRLTSPLSRGPHMMLMDGASLVRGPGDVLELLYPLHGRRAEAPQCPPRRTENARLVHLSPDLTSLLERVGSGCDTPDRLTRAGADPAEVLLGLSELELMGVLARGDGGRYVLRDPLPGDG